MVWKVRISQHMYGYFNPAVYIFRLFGIFPFTTKRTSSGLFFKWSPWYTLYSYSLALLLSGASLSEAIIGMFFKGGVKLDIINNTDNFVWLFTVTIYCLATFSGTFITPKKFRKLCGYIKCINRVDEMEISSTNSKISFDIASTILLVDNAVVIISIVATYLSHDSIASAMYSIMVRVLPFALHVFVGNMVQYMIRLLLRILIMKFVCLNKALGLEYQKLEKGKMVDYERMSGRYLISEDYLQTTTGDGRAAPLLFTSNDEKIMILSKAYLKLMEAAQILNNYFGLIILTVMASSLFQLISTPYHIILSLQGKRRGIGETLRRLLKFSEQLIRVLILVEPMYECSEKIEKTGREVCNLLSLNLNPRYRKQVDAFAMCICLKKIKFSAWGCFYIDRFLLSSLVGTITTYVCILLQAQENEGK